MGLHHFLMKHGIGSPGYIAKTMCKHYVALKAIAPSQSEDEILRHVYTKRAFAQGALRGPEEYRSARSNPDIVESVVRLNPNLLSLVRLAVLIEHPEFKLDTGPADRFVVLDTVLLEVLNKEAPEWKKQESIAGVIVDGSQFQEPVILQLPMLWTAWHNGSHHKPFSGFGFKVSEADRDLYFQRDWKIVTIALPVSEGFLLTDANIDKQSFWENCRELITADIGLWMLAHKYAPWKKGQPPRFSVRSVGSATFAVEPQNNDLGHDGPPDSD